jgi:hypothetical protein
LTVVSNQYLRVRVGQRRGRAPPQRAAVLRSKVRAAAEHVISSRGIRSYAAGCDEGRQVLWTNADDGHDADSLVHAHGRNVPRHVRVVMSWIGEILKEQLD